MHRKKNIKRDADSLRERRQDELAVPPGIFFFSPAIVISKWNVYSSFRSYRADLEGSQDT